MGSSLISCLILLLNMMMLGCLAQPFSQNPLLVVNLTSGTPSFVKIAPDQSMIVIAFTSNVLMGYNFEGQNTVEFNTSGIFNFQQLEWVQGVGPIVLASGTVYVWYANGTFMGSHVLASNISITVMATSSSGGIPYVALGSNDLPVYFNQIYLPEYKIANGQFVFNQNYSVPNAQPTTLMYSPGRQYFFVATQQNQMYLSELIVTFNCSTGDNNGANPNFLNPGQYISNFAPYVNGSFLMTDNLGFVYYFTAFNASNQGIYYQKLGTPLAAPNFLGYCPQTNYFVISSSGNSNNSLVVYEQDNYALEALQSFSGRLTAFDCSQKYLVSVNIQNQLIITTYSSGSPTNGSGLPVWAIAMIVVLCIGVFVFLIILAFILVKKRKKEHDYRIGMNNSTAKEWLGNSQPNQVRGQYGTVYHNQNTTQYKNYQMQQSHYLGQYPQNQYPNPKQTKYQDKQSNKFYNQTQIVDKKYTKYQQNTQNKYNFDHQNTKIQPNFQNPYIGNLQTMVQVENISLHPVLNETQLNPTKEISNMTNNQ